MTLEDVLKVLAALGGFGGVLATLVFGGARYIGELNKQVVDTTVTAYEKRLAEKDVAIAELKADKSEAAKLIAEQSASQLRQIDQQARLIDVLQATKAGR